MKKIIEPLVVIISLCVCSTSIASAQDLELYSNIVSSKFEGTIPIQIVGPLSKIEASIYADDGTTGGLIGNIIGGIQNKRKKRKPKIELFQSSMR